MVNMINLYQLILFTIRGVGLPRDKSETNAKIIECMKEEFLARGYEKASLNRVSAKVGITTAALYKHFKNKEDMFFFLVKDTLDDFENLNDSNQDEMKSNVEYDPFRPEWIETFIDFIFEHYEGLKLLICCSEGSAYENFEEKLIDMEAAGNKEYASILKDSGHSVQKITDMQWHMLATAYIHLIFEVVRHDMTREEASEHIKFICELLYPGWKKIFGL